MPLGIAPLSGIPVPPYQLSAIFRVRYRISAPDQEAHTSNQHDLLHPDTRALPLRPDSRDG